jgi:NADPH:quinone reductase
MKAVILRAFGSADNFEDADLPLPELRPGDVRIKVSAASFNPIDYQIRKGGPEGRSANAMILGRDLSGVIETVHESVTGFNVGDEVFTYVCKLANSGTYAEYVSVPAELVAKKPASLTHAEAAAVPVAGITARMALDKLRPTRERSIFIAGGAGGVGSFAIMLARELGAGRLFTTAGSEASRGYLIERCGLQPNQIVDYRQSGFVEEAMRRNGGAFDAVLDLVGGRMLAACCELVALNGDLASVTDAPSQESFEFLFSNNASFHPIGANAYSLSPDRRMWTAYRGMLDRLARGFDEGTLSVPQVKVVGTLSAETVRRGHALLETGGVQGKVVMAW